MQVLDYSTGFPGAAAIRRAGYGGAVRYVGYPDRRKCTTAAELVDFDAHQLGMALVFENDLTDWQGGYSRGQASGRLARDHANAIGFPADRPIYMAVDQDVVTGGDFALMVAYLRGAGQSLGGPELTGVYGEADVIDRARQAGVAGWFWQTAAWSRGRKTAAHLYQHPGAVTVAGISCDINDALGEDWGQHNAEDTMPTLPEIVDAIKTQVLAGDWRFDNRNPIDIARQSLANSFITGVKIDTLTAKLDILTAGVSEAEADILAAVRAGGLDAQAFATVLAGLLAPMIQAGATPEQIEQATADAVRQAFARAGSTG